MNVDIWADFIITEVNQKNGKIEFLKVSNHTGNYLVNETILSNYEVIELLRQKKHIITAYRLKNDEHYRFGSKVVLYKDLRGIEYFRTESNHLSPDNLDNLPKFSM